MLCIWRIKWWMKKVEFTFVRIIKPVVYLTQNNKKYINVTMFIWIKMLL